MLNTNVTPKKVGRPKKATVKASFISSDHSDAHQGKKRGRKKGWKKATQSNIGNSFSTPLQKHNIKDIRTFQEMLEDIIIRASTIISLAKEVSIRLK